MVGGKMEAEALVAASPELVFDYLAQLENHWRLMDDSVEVLSLDGDGEAGANRAVVRLHGPLGLGRVARTQVVEATRPRLLRGTAQIGRRSGDGARTVGEVLWLHEPDGGGTRVRLSATVTRAGLGDRMLLGLGGRAWMAARFRLALRHLAELYAAGATTPVSRARV